MSRGQISLEFIVIMSAAVMMLVAFLVIGADQLTESTDVRRQTAVVDIAETIQQELAAGYSVHNGYRRVFSLPPILESAGYVVNLQQDGQVSVATVISTHSSFSVRVPYCNGTLVPGRNVLRKENDTLWCNV